MAFKLKSRKQGKSWNLYLHRRKRASVQVIKAVWGSLGVSARNYN